MCSSDLEREATAWHEAGHAVVAHALGVPVHYVTIVPEGSTLGHCRTGEKGQDWPSTEADIIVSYAGEAAQHMRMLTWLHEGAGGDRENIEYAARKLYRGKRRATKEQALMRLEERARDLVLEELPSIDAVARALLRFHTLVGHDILDLLIDNS